MNPMQSFQDDISQTMPIHRVPGHDNNALDASKIQIGGQSVSKSTLFSRV